jgi:hypothetical protein
MLLTFDIDQRGGRILLYLIRMSLLILIVMLSAPIITFMIAEALLNRGARAEAFKILKTAKTDQREVINEADLADLPIVVQKWLRRAGIVGKEKIHCLKMIQTGQMRLAENKPWMKFEALQYVNVDEPAFVWKARVKYAPLIKLIGLDQYYEGHGSMNIKLMALVSVVDARPGMEMDQGSLLRFLAEMIWYPTAALNNYISWEEIDERSARATMTWKGTSASMIMNFNEEGDMVSSVAPRYREEDGQFILDDWGGVARSYKKFEGIRIINQNDVVWKFKTGDFNWMQIEVVDVDFNYQGYI